MRKQAWLHGEEGTARPETEGRKESLGIGQDQNISLFETVVGQEKRTKTKVRKM